MKSPFNRKEQFQLSKIGGKNVSVPSPSLSYWEANCYYPRGPITGKGISSNLKRFFSPVLEIVILFHFDAVILMGTGDAFSVVILSRTSGECLV